MSYFHQQSVRLNFRKLKSSDIESWAEFFVDNTNLHYLGLMNALENEKLNDLELSESWINKQFVRYEESGFGLLAIELKSTGELIGQAGIMRKEVDGETCYEVGYSIKPKFWRQGFASEMSAQLIDYAVENKVSDKLISIIHIDNIGSIKIAERNKMQIVRTSRYADMDVFIYGREL
ncbi:MAG: hypothetical protein COA86_17710 [Kangiella sp.]|nr:MAG: hypothetical protein COA86_17710 [Kangiella sp.]